MGDYMLNTYQKRGRRRKQFDWGKWDGGYEIRENWMGANEMGANGMGQ